MVLIGPRGAQGIVGLPMEAREVTLGEIQSAFPPDNILEQWYQGIDVEWPPDEDEDPLPTLRFPLGTRVECRIGPTEWIRGTITQLWYQDDKWDSDQFAPYKVQLVDGRSIFAPADLDQVIRLDGAAPDFVHTANE